MSELVFLRQVELTVEADAATEEVSGAMFAAVNAYAERLSADLAAHGPRGLRAVRVTVRPSAALRAVMTARDAWELTIEETRS